MEKETDRLIIKNGVLVTPFERLPQKVLFLRNGIIERIINNSEFEYYPREIKEKYRVIDAGGNYISPGFIDIHCHGAVNIDAATGPYQPWADYNLRHGTTGFLPTFWNMKLETLIKACARISRFMKEQESGSRVLGINSEGPYINPELGAQSKQNAIIPRYEDYSRIIEASGGNLKIMTVSSEVEGYEELVKYLRLHGVLVALGYCSASTPRIERELELGLTHIDHIFDCFSGPGPVERGVKAAGIEEDLLVCDQLMAEVIADKKGVHVAPAWLKILVRCKGVENIILVSDSRDIAGNPPGEYILQDGLKAYIEEGRDVVRLASGDLAGCAMSMNEAVKNMVSHTGISLEESVMMATHNPAKALGISHKKGELKQGMDADLAIFDKDLDIKMVIQGGRMCVDNVI